MQITKNGWELPSTRNIFFPRILANHLLTKDKLNDVQWSLKKFINSVFCFMFILVGVFNCPITKLTLEIVIFLFIFCCMYVSINVVCSIMYAVCIYMYVYIMCIYVYICVSCMCCIMYVYVSVICAYMYACVCYVYIMFVYVCYVCVYVFSCEMLWFL